MIKLKIIMFETGILFISPNLSYCEMKIHLIFITKSNLNMHIASSESYNLLQTQTFKTFLYDFMNKYNFKQYIELPEGLQSVTLEMFILFHTAT